MTPQQEEKLNSVQFGAEANVIESGQDIAQRLVQDLVKLPQPLRLDLARALERLQDELDDSRQGN